MTSTTVSQHMRDLIEQTLRANLSRWHYESFQAEALLDGTGDPAIVIGVRFEPLGEMPTSEATTRTLRELLDRLREEGDPRIPYLDYQYPQEPEIDEAE